MPAFQFYPADWRKDPGVQALDFHDRGVWFEILCIMHESSERGVLLLNGRPMPEPALARMLGLDNQILTATLTNLLTYGVASKREHDGALYSRRMVKDENLCQVRREAGKKGGNPNLVKQNSTTGDNQSPTPSSSSSISSSSSEIETTSSLRSEVEAPQKKIDLSPEIVSPAPESSTTELRTPGGAADVGTRKPRAAFTPPTYEDMLAYMVSQRPHNARPAVERVAAKCFGYYSGNGWKVGKNPMKDWKGACQTFLADLPKLAAGQPGVVIQQGGYNGGFRPQPSQVSTRAAAIAGADAMFDAMAAGQDPFANRTP